jgi:hypothetical protein
LQFHNSADSTTDMNALLHSSLYADPLLANDRAKNGVLDRVFEPLQNEQIVRIKIEALSLDSTSVKVHPDGTGALKKTAPQAIGKSRGGWNTQIHMVAADARTALTFALFPGNDHDAPHGGALLEGLGPMPQGLSLLMDRAYEGDETRRLKGFRRIFSRFEKLDLVFLAFLCFALIVEALRLA